MAELVRYMSIFIPYRVESDHLSGKIGSEVPHCAHEQVHPWKPYRFGPEADKLLVARDERWTRLTCDHKGTYADDVRLPPNQRIEFELT